MIKPKPDVGNECWFAAKITNWGKYEHWGILVGKIVKKNSPQSFDIEYDDWYSNGHTTIVKNVVLSHIHSFEWGGIMALNSQRNKKLFQKIGSY